MQASVNGSIPKIKRKIQFDMSNGLKSVQSGSGIVFLNRRRYFLIESKAY